MRRQTAALSCPRPNEPRPADFRFPPPREGRSRHERAADLAAAVDRAVLAELCRLREHGCSIHAMARLTGLEASTVATLLNETGAAVKTSWG